MEKKESLLLGPQSLENLDLEKLTNAIKNECKKGEVFPRRISDVRTYWKVRKIARIHYSKLMDFSIKDETEQARAFLYEIKKCKRWFLGLFCGVSFTLLIAFLETIFKMGRFFQDINLLLFLIFLFGIGIANHIVRKNIQRYLCFLLVIHDCETKGEPES